MNDRNPPRFMLRFFRWFCHPKMKGFIEGDLMEIYYKRVAKQGKRKADIKFTLDVLLLFRPGIIRPIRNHQQVNHFGMFKSYFTIGWRNLWKNKSYAVINIGGLAIGMAVATLIGLWIYDELTYNEKFEHHNRIAQVVVRGENSSGKFVQWNTAPPFAAEIRNVYGNEFTHALMSSRPNENVLSFKDTKITRTGYFMEPGAADMLSLRMIKGTRTALSKREAIFLSASTVKALFGDRDPMDETIKIKDRPDVIVTGVYEDIADNTDFNDMSFLGTWDAYVAGSPWLKKDSWQQNGFMTFVELTPKADFKSAASKISNIRLAHANDDEKVFKFQVDLHPMNDWRLYSDIEQGGRDGRIRFVWIYGSIGLFVLLLACINFMNLATARSERRAREVGVRKSMGSARSQLISQFFSESILVTIFAFLTSLVLIQGALPMFNAIAEKKILMPWSNVYWWLSAVAFIVLTGFISGSYPALYLSSFQPVKVLKGTFKAGRFASMPRKVLVVIQFTVSITLIIGVMVVFRQIEFGRERSTGYQQEGLISVKSSGPEIHQHIDALRNELKSSGAVIELSESLNPVTNISFVTNGFDWTGTGPDMQSGFPTIFVAHEYGKTLGWEFIEGRDFSREIASDTSAIVLNETAAKYMNLKDPVGKEIKWSFFGKPRTLTVIGVIKDMLMESPYYAVRKSIYMIDTASGNFVNIRLNPAMSQQKAIAGIESVFKKYNPETPFEFSFVDEDYDRKFAEEQRVGRLASVFAWLAILISCLGIFGLASFMAEQRIKEIGIRKVLGASVGNLWQMLSKDFVALVIISCALAMPLSYYFMRDWLSQYEYRTNLSWYLFAFAGCGAMVITLLTVSYQAVRAALANPVRSLRSE